MKLYYPIMEIVIIPGLNGMTSSGFCTELEEPHGFVFFPEWFIYIYIIEI